MIRTMEVALGLSIHLRLVNSPFIEMIIEMKELKA